MKILLRRITSSYVYLNLNLRVELYMIDTLDSVNKTERLGQGTDILHLLLWNLNKLRHDSITYLLKIGHRSVVTSTSPLQSREE